jgi:hypothetical protein
MDAKPTPNAVPKSVMILAIYYTPIILKRIEQVVKVEVVLDGAEAPLPKLTKKVLLLLFHLLLNLPNLLEFLDSLVLHLGRRGDSGARDEHLSFDVIKALLLI